MYGDEASVGMRPVWGRAPRPSSRAQRGALLAPGEQVFPGEGGAGPDAPEPSLQSLLTNRVI
jgi:hypothetical protein